MQVKEPKDTIGKSPYLSRILRATTMDPSTRKTKSAHVNAFTAYLQEQHPSVNLSNFQLTHIFAWGQLLARDHEFTPQGCRNYLTAIRQLYTQRDENRPSLDEVLVKWPFEWNALMRMASKKSVKAARPISIDDFKKANEEIRAVLAFLAATGIRFGSLINLQKSHVSKITQNYMVVQLPKLKSIPKQVSDANAVKCFCNCMKKEGAKGTDSVERAYCAMHAGKGEGEKGIMKFLPIRSPHALRKAMNDTGLTGHSGRRTKALFLKMVVSKFGCEPNLKAINRDFKWSNKTETMWSYYSRGVEPFELPRMFPLYKISKHYMQSS